MMDEKIREISGIIADCIRACNNCFDACLDEEDVKMMAECIRLDRDCAEVCSLAMNAIHRDSRFSRELLMLCKNVCIVCKQECRKHPYDHCQRCADACKACAEACQKFIDSYPDDTGNDDNMEM